MAVAETTTDFDWGGEVGFDLHLLKGSSYDLLADLFVNNQIQWVPASGPGLPPDLTRIEFTTDVSAAALTDNGITINAATGKVDVTVAVPAGPPLRNLIVRCAAIHTSAAVPSPIERFIRIHVHKAVSKLWLTPHTLTIHMGGVPAHLTVLAKFDDGVVGDVTAWRSLTWSSNPPANVSVDAASGALTASTVGSMATIRVVLPTVAGASDSVVVNCKPAWTTAQDVEFVAGKGPASRGEVRNILFLPDGFAVADKPKFKNLVRRIVKLLGTTKVMRPYDALAGSLNYWLTFVESADAGNSILPDAAEFTRGAKKMARLVPPASKPAAAAATWTLPELIFSIGLPVPVDDPPTRPLTGGASPKLTDWQALYGPGITEAKVRGAYAAWRALAGYLPVNERNTAFGLAIGNRASLRRNDQILRVLGLDPRRNIVAQVEGFLSNLTFRGTTIGTTWAPGGADRGLVCFVGRSLLIGGEQHEAYFGGTLADDDEFAVTAPPAGRPGLDIVPVTIPLHPTVIVWKVAHECGHAFGLLDEYGDGSGKHFPATKDAELDKAGNLEPRDRVSTAGSLDGAKIKWLWPRIHHAGVTKAVPVDEGAGVFRVSLRAGHGAHFSRGDIVRLRLRDAVTDPALSDALEVTDVAGDVVKVKLAGAGTFTAATWIVTSVLLAPTRKAGAAPDSLLPLVAPKVRDFITSSHSSLNGPLPAGSGGNEIMTPVHLPAGLRIPKTKAFIVGLYEGGYVDFDFDVFHPAGLCRMRSLSDGSVGVIRFCHVCRYLIVDKVDPSKHFDIDRIYSTEYPEP